MPKIGLGVQPATYLSAREGDLPTRLSHPARAAAHLGMRAVTAAQSGSNQGVSGTLAAGWAGHTALHSRDASGPLTTGFSPDGDLPAARIALGPNGMLTPTSASILGAGFGFAWAKLQGADATTSSATAAVLGYSMVAASGSADVPGAFHDETGLEHDPDAIAMTVEVGPGVHGAFRQLQRDLVDTPLGDGIYSFRPDQRATHNCVTAAVSELGAFVGRARAHAAVMGEMQGGFRVTGSALPSRLAGVEAVELSDNQRREVANLETLSTRTGELKEIIDAAQQRGSGNQGRVSAHLRRTGASRDDF